MVQSTIMTKTCLLIHGFGSSPRDLSYLKKYLTERGFNAKTITLSGHGGDRDDLAHSCHKCWVRSARKALEHMAPEKVHIIGHSMGGLICAQLSGYAHVEKIVFLATPVFFWNVKIMLKELVLALIYWDFTRIEYYRNAVRHYRVKSGYDFLRVLVATGKWFKRIKKPVLILQGKSDESVWPISARYIKNHVGVAAKLKYYKGGSHMMMNDQVGIREKVCKDIADFLESEGI